MKMIDFTPLVTMGYKKVLTRLAIASFAVALAVKMAGYQELASGLASVSYTHLTLPTKLEV